MKILITGAHFTPAVATIEELKKMDGVEVVYVGRKTTLEGDKALSVESKVLPAMGVKFIPIITGRLQRSFTPYTIPSLLKIPIGLIQALYIILSEKPDVILSFGGYVAVPVVIVGWLFSIPTIVHEQTITLGLANRINSIFADKIAASFEKGVLKGEKVILTGNPVRQNILDLSRLPAGKAGPGDITEEYSEIFKSARKDKKPVILFTGGNQGSHVINLAVEESLDKLLKIACIIHVTGDNKFEDFERLQGLQTGRYLVKKWIGEEWGVILSQVDLVICRAGINTLNELAYLGKPALIIPIASSEQNKNAKYFEELGLVKVLSQSKLSGETLLRNIRLLLNGLNYLTKKTKEAKKIIIPDAAKRLALETVLLGQKIEANRI
ncbi:hypothetical protein A2867_02415 [Candidatus Daviesbacteria bacterium RIFCSPHIGHO2_01_FULL_40_11]|uniref:UDP-N-acetylglucosamine--N-acetylmuramyl-(pentapeptide) pyrophosphoryl-undecaprenol N-acetylglucosamine transferase n=1 Tax=Candidatus Daviesbacteria bacterium RIFCSPHIGHO2_01_FULL_40_11 TaxID=1797762 RepID=A0A1F5JH71_9BACT|nr:MAG: hypothetical protein A2867_02415 [Candidatus Daviesbacteria bacterium RIFCSPHIGHO2_01_FULL_40_11]OGE62815.1 MAG: hypothetical protein A2964_01880 [Candidatus Daviesbacteria bacterium RIFCSPLOWO2_01_FULL_40_27]